MTTPKDKPTRVPKRKPWTLPLNKPEEFEIKVIAGCPFCDFDEAEGGLVNHCRDCQHEIVTAAYELFVRLGYSMQPRDAHATLLSQRDAAVAALKKYGDHTNTCNDDPRHECICGFDSALKACGV